ncbi:exodeoxyribonuclease VII small subunit [Neorhodopirellula lusitana]
MKSESSIDFETSLGEIEKIVRALESGELTLDDSLTQYETAVAKMRQCYRLLEVAERKISVLAGFDAEGNPVSEAFDDGSSQGSDGDSLIAKQKNRGRRRGVGSGDSSDATQDED